MKTSSEFKLAFVALLALSATVFSGKSYENLLRGIDSNIHARVSMDVTSHGFLPKLPMTVLDPGSKTGMTAFNDHPFFYFWMNGWIMRGLGPSAWSARILTAAFSVACVAMTFLIGCELYSILFGFISALIFLFTRDIILTGATLSLDPPLLFFILLSFWFWLRGHWRLAAMSAGFGLWFKTPVVLLVYPTATIVLLIQKKLKSQFKNLLSAFIISLGIGSIIWLLTGALGGWALVQDYWVRQLWGTAIQGRNTVAHQTDWFIFFRFIKNGFIPGLPLLLVALYQITKKKRWSHPIVVISVSAILVLGLVITLIRFRMDYYLNPAFPFLALLSTFSVIYYAERVEAKIYFAFIAIVPVLLAFLLCTPTSFGPEAFVALKRFIPLIQYYGDCEDHILLIPGDEPIGSSHDYKLVLDFYTGRQTDIAQCRDASTAIQKLKPSWMILSRENYEHCLNNEQQDSFQTKIQMGNQYLLSHLIPQANQIDLTPLENEFKAVSDCKRPPTPRDIYHRY